MNTTINEDVMLVLKGCWVEGDKVYLLPKVKLERDLYEGVNEVLTRLGGKWKGGKVSAYVFPFDPSPVLEIVLSSEIMPPKNPLAFFPTETGLAVDLLDRVLHECKNRWDSRLLEPSAGLGGLILPMLDDPGLKWLGKMDLVEIDEFRSMTLLKKLVSLGLERDRFSLFNQDFLDFKPEFKYDAIVMNPPLNSVVGEKKDSLIWTDHVLYALELLKPNGVLGAILPQSLLYRDTKRVNAVRTILERRGADIEKVAQGAFEDTNMATVIVVVKGSV